MAERWRQFEKRVTTDLLGTGQIVTHIPSHVGMAKNGVHFRKKTDCDFAAGVNGKAVFFDAKVCGDNRFNIASLILRQEKIHQYMFLKSCVERGNIGGYLIWFYNHGKIVWLPVENVSLLVENKEKSVSLLSPEISVQNDDKPILLSKLIWGT